MTVSLMPHQRLSLCWMVKQEQDGFLHGGILADDQGLGKLITTIALILTHKPTHVQNKTLLISIYAILESDGW